MRVDGLPRVVFTVGKDVEQGLRGKLHGYLRGKFKRRARMAFKISMEEIRKKDPRTLPSLSFPLSCVGVVLMIGE